MKTKGSYKLAYKMHMWRIPSTHLTCAFCKFLLFSYHFPNLITCILWVFALFCFVSLLFCQKWQIFVIVCGVVVKVCFEYDIILESSYLIFQFFYQLYLLKYGSDIQIGTLMAKDQICEISYMKISLLNLCGVCQTTH